ncbi:MAG: chromate efflux transporter [Acidobacteria bacterium]|nr:chromate efflux transporter [Acidobacteriota bacterium]MCA1609831.1 chromate efflux transporter [Acidobacteriota bacterium]
MRDSDEVPRVAFGAALRYWAALGCVNFGGPAGQIAMLHRDLVVRRRWISEERFLRALNFCMLLPGPEATELAIYIGWLLHGPAGGVAAGVLFLLPSVVVLLGLSWAYAAHGNLPLVAGALAGLKPVVVAVVAAAVWKIGRRALKRPLDGAIAAGAFLALTFLHASFPLVIAAAAAAGALRRSERGTPASDPSTGGETAPAGTLPARRRNIRLLLLFCALWAAPLLLVSAALGWDGTHARAYRFFSQAAFVTFGGAYAVLTYVVHAAVGPFHWLSPAQAIDGLALAETTPGPLIMVLTFIGYLAGWQSPGALSPAASGALAALLTTWATFLPCFFFILLGAPWIERLRGRPRLDAALSGITAAVVGVILNLAVLFASAVLFPRGLAAGPDPFSLALASAALAVLLLFDLEAAWVVLAGGTAGLVRAVVLGRV